MRAAAILGALLLCACEREPSFDERYETAQESIEDKAKELDAQLEDPQPETESQPDAAREPGDNDASRR